MLEQEYGVLCTGALYAGVAGTEVLGYYALDFAGAGILEYCALVLLEQEYWGAGFAGTGVLEC